jgi:hypothetical protein
MYIADVVLGLFHMFGDCYPMKVERIRKGKFLDCLSFGFHVHHAHKTDWCEYNIFYRGILVAGLNAGVAIHLLYRITETVSYCSRRYFWVGVVQPMSADIEQSTPLSVLDPATIWTWQAFLLAATVSQVTHAASHDRWGKDKVAGQVYRLVEGILIVSRDAHKLHHTSYNCNYCITTGWGNLVVNWVFRTFVQPRLDPSLQSEVSQKVYGNGLKNGLMEPYYELFPEWRESK